MRPKLGELLVRNRLIAADQLRVADDLRGKEGGSLADALLRLRYIDEDGLSRALDQEGGIRYVRLGGVNLDPSLLSLVPWEIARRLKCIPLARSGLKLSVAMVDVEDVLLVDELRFVTGMDVEPVMASELAILAAIAKYYSEDAEALLEAPVPAAGEASGGDAAINPTRAADAPLVEPCFEPLEFTAFHPRSLVPGQWSTALAYAHVPTAIDSVLADSTSRLRTAGKEFRRANAVGSTTVARGAEVLVVPDLRGCRFNPPAARFIWLEDWHCAEFRVQALPEAVGADVGRAVEGRISFYVGPVLIGEVDVRLIALAETGSRERRAPPRQSTTAMYQSVFVSYSHRDAAIATQLESAYEALGLTYLRDVKALRSGEEWGPALLKKIDQADIFQLLWSYSARQSDQVEREWRHALGQERRSFIRPVFWETPMPEPPPELRRIHFAYLPWNAPATSPPS